MHVTHLKIRNLRSIASTDIALNTPGMSPSIRWPNVNVMLGANGFGKTSVLRAVALASLGPLLSSSSGFVPEGLIRRIPGRQRAVRPGQSTSVAATVTLSAAELPPYAQALWPNAPLTLTTDVLPLGTSERLGWQVEPQGASALVERLLYDDASAAFFIVGYGATRRVEASTRVDESARIKSRRRRYDRVASLFEDYLGLMPLSYWLPDYAKRNKGRHVQVVHLINRLLPPACRMRSTPTDTDSGVEHLFEMNGVTLPFRALSDGYRAYVGWIGDMLFHLCMGAAQGAKLVETQGVVLVDEIDLHLHPEWQRVVLPTLAQALPNVQFIVTTHSPLVVGSLEADNLFLLVQQQDGGTVVTRIPERVHGRSAEQILLSPYFGLDSTRSPDVADQLQSLAQATLQGDPAASMQYLRLLSSGQSRPAEPS